MRSINTHIRIVAYETTKEDHPNNYQECSQGVPPMQGKVCQMDKIRQVCLPENNFNYDSLDGGPCIFLKLNKVRSNTNIFRS